MKDGFLGVLYASLPHYIKGDTPIYLSVVKDRHGGFGRDSRYLHVIVYPLKIFIHI